MTQRIIFIISFILVLNTNFVSAQTLEGIIMNTTANPIANATVYYSGSSVSTKSDHTGYFKIDKLAHHRELIISHPTYGTEVIAIEEKDNNYLEIFLSPKIELPATIATAISKEDRENALIKFREHLLGLSKNGLKCKILNEDIIKFQYANNKEVIYAYASEPLIIENRNLGYLIHFDLVSFELNQKENTIFYAGYPLFKELKSKPSKRHQKNRNIAYNGSLQHFLRSVFTNTFIAEGFEVRKIEKKINPNYPSDSLLREAKSAIKKSLTLDLNSWYGKVLRQAQMQSKYIHLLYPELLQREAFTISLDDRLFLDFDYTLDVQYTLEKETKEYIEKLPYDQQQFEKNQTSQIWITAKVEILESGIHFPSEALWTADYLGFEKLGDMVPANFVTVP